MTKPVIVTRAGKGSALTWTEGDSNVTNLQNATVTLKAGTGGTDVVSDLNGTVTLVAGTNVTLSGDNSAKTVTINSTASGGASTLNDLTDVTITGSPSTGQVIKWSSATSQWTNQSDAGIDGVYADPNPSLGGNLTVMGYSIVSSANGDIAITPNGTGNIVLDGQKWPQADGTANQVLKTDGAGQLSWTTAGGGGLANVVEDLTPQLGGNLDVNGQSIVSTSNGNITIAPDGTGDVHLVTDAVRVGDLNTEARISTYGTGNLVLTTNEGHDPDPSITIGNGDNADITLTPSGTGKIVLDGLNWPTADGLADQVLKTNGSGQLSFSTVSAGATTLDGLSDVVITAAATNDVLVYNGTNWVDTAANTLTVSAASTATTATNADNINISTTDGNTSDTTMYPVFVSALSTGNQLPHVDSGIIYNANLNSLTATQFVGGLDGIVGSITPAAGTFTTMTAAVSVLDDIRETVFALTYAATITPDAANGSVQTVTLTGNVTFSAFTNPVSGQSITLIITQDATGSRTLTSTMLFAGGSKTLTTAANAVDILTVSYIGTTYYASLSKAFA